MGVNGPAEVFTNKPTLFQGLEITSRPAQFSTPISSVSSLRSVSASFQFHGVHKTYIKIVAIIKFAATSPKTTILPYEGLKKEVLQRLFKRAPLG